MPFIATRPQDNVPLRLSYGRPSLWEHIQTAVDTTLYDLPSQNLDRAIDLFYYGRVYNQISAKEANKRYGIEGHVKFEEPISWKKAELISQLKREELERMQMLEMGNDTFFRKTAFFASSLGTQILDPINLAAMFIPVVQEERFAAMVTKFGLTKARMLAGTFESAVGMATVEPMSYLSKAMGEQNAYGPADSAMNMFLGTAIGVGLRVGGGELKDLFVTYNADDVLAGNIKKKETARNKLILTRIKQEAENAARQQGFKKGTPEFTAAVKQNILAVSDTSGPIWYHGRNPAAKITDGPIFFTSNKDFAASLANERETTTGKYFLMEGDTIIGVYASAEEAIKARSKGPEEQAIVAELRGEKAQVYTGRLSISKPAKRVDIIATIQELIDEKGIVYVQKAIDKYIPEHNKRITGSPKTERLVNLNETTFAHPEDMLYVPDMIARLKEKGFDGYIDNGLSTSEIPDPDYITAIVFSSSQIRPGIDESFMDFGGGTWDATSVLPLTPQNNILLETQRYLTNVDPATHRKAFEEGINNVLNDEPIAGPSAILELDALERQRQQMVAANLEQEVTGTLRVVPTEAGTEITVNKTKVLMTAENDVISLKAVNVDSDVDLQGIVMGQAKAALQQGKDLVLDNQRLNQEVLEAFVNGVDTLAKRPEPVKPKNIWDDFDNEIVVDPSKEHLDYSTPEKAHESSVKTAEEINAQAEEIIADIKRLVGEKNLKKTLAVAEKQGLDPKDLAEILAADPSANKKYREWLAKQFKEKKILKEDIAKVRERLTQFEELTKKALFTDEKDLNKYGSYQELARTVDKYLEAPVHVALQEKLRKAGPGAKVVREPTADNPLTVVESSDAKACSTMGEGSEWCTVSKEVARNYIAGDSVRYTKDSFTLSETAAAKIKEDLSKLPADSEITEDALFSVAEDFVNQDGVLLAADIFNSLDPEQIKTYKDFIAVIDNVETHPDQPNKLYQVFDENGEPLAQIDPKSGQIMSRYDEGIVGKAGNQYNDRVSYERAVSALLKVPEEEWSVLYTAGEEEFDDLIASIFAKYSMSEEEIAYINGAIGDAGTADYSSVIRMLDELSEDSVSDKGNDYLGPEKTKQLRQAIDEAGIKPKEFEPNVDGLDEAAYDANNAFGIFMIDTEAFAVPAAKEAPAAAPMSIDDKIAAMFAEKKRNKESASIKDLTTKAEEPTATPKAEDGAVGEIDEQLDFINSDFERTRKEKHVDVTPLPLDNMIEQAKSPVARPISIPDLLEVVAANDALVSVRDEPVLLSAEAGADWKLVADGDKNALPGMQYKKRGDAAAQVVFNPKVVDALSGHPRVLENILKQAADEAVLSGDELTVSKAAHLAFGGIDGRQAPDTRVTNDITWILNNRDLVKVVGDEVVITLRPGFEDPGDIVDGFGASRFEEFTDSFDRIRPGEDPEDDAASEAARAGYEELMSFIRENLEAGEEVVLRGYSSGEGIDLKFLSDREAAQVSEMAKDVPTLAEWRKVEEPAAATKAEEPTATPKAEEPDAGKVADGEAEPVDDLRAEIEAMFNEYSVPENVRQQILDDFEAPDRLQDEQNGITAAIDCFIRNAL